MKEDILRIWDYNFWASERFTAKLQNFSEEEFCRDLGDGCGSVRDKLGHILGADKVWLERIQGKVNPFLPASEIKDIRFYMDLSEKIQSDYKKILNELTEENLQNRISYKNLKGLDFSTPLFEILLHVANHATYHRGQAASLVRRIKGSPPVTDMIEYFRSKSAG